MAVFPALTLTESWYEENLLKKRNRVMAGRVIEILRSDPGSSHFFAFGVGHFLGQQSVVTLVREAGFQVDRIGVRVEEEEEVEEDLKVLPQFSGGERSASETVIVLCLSLLVNILLETFTL